VLTGTEECDDGNADDTDECIAGCILATCGDGFTWAGMEGCDDANDIDDDACSNTCVMASCGDMVVQQGESATTATPTTPTTAPACARPRSAATASRRSTRTCDDGNTDDTDMCVAGCLVAACGDGFVLAGTEGCDDANADETDACTTLCQPPACDDMLLSGSESDVDCGGGSCPKCADGQCATPPTDCMSGACLMNVCAPPQTCKDLLAGDPALPTASTCSTSTAPGRSPRRTSTAT
jgi:cysteine-rich repeat protein